MKKTVKKKKTAKSKKTAGTPKAKVGVAILISKLQEQLNTIEEKLDSLISQSAQRPSRGRDFNRSGGRDRGRGGRDFGERTFTKAICAGCNTECEIPFKPTGDRPVYCSECFSKRKEDSSFNSGRNNRSEGRGFSRDRRPGRGRDRKNRASFDGRKSRG